MDSIGSPAHNIKLHEDAECGWWMAGDGLFEGLGNEGKDINMVQTWCGTAMMMKSGNIRLKIKDDTVFTDVHYDPWRLRGHLGRDPRNTIYRDW